MSSLSSEPSANELASPRRAGFDKILRSRWTFVGLQVLDLLTTLVAFHVGFVEVNPLVARLTVFFGRFRGLVISKLIAIVIAMGVRKRLWIVNIFYVGVACWNIIVLVYFALRLK
jgi:hypothetical protein